MSVSDDRTASYRIQDGRGPGRQIGFHVLLERERKLGVRQDGGIAISASRTLRNIHMPIEIVEPDLCMAELSRVPAPGGDVDGAVACQGVLSALVHQLPPVEMTSGAWLDSQTTRDFVNGEAPQALPERS